MPDPRSRSFGAPLAVALLDFLSADVRLGERARAVALLGDEAGLRRGDLSPGPERLGEAIRAVGLDVDAARRVGALAARSPAVVAQMRAQGIATPERAYRQCDRIAAREDERGRYAVASLSLRADRGTACIDYHSDAPETSLLCAMRAGVLACLPEAFGGARARVVSTACRERGDRCCSYRVEWIDASAGAQRRARIAASGLATLAFVGAAFAGASAIVAFAIGAGLAVAALVGARAARAPAHESAVDPESALLAIEQRIAERADALAKLDARIDAMPVGERSLPSRDLPNGVAEATARARRELALAQSTLQSAGAATGDELDAIAARLSRAALAVEAISELVGSPGCVREREDLRALVERVALTSQRAHPSGPRIEWHADAGLPFVMCDGAEVESAIAQLVRRAVDAAGPSGSVAIEAREATGGVELSVTDDGPGIGSVAVDEAFDPFLAPRAGAASSAGLSGVAEILARHASELQVASGDGAGTRVAFVLAREARIAR